VHTAQPDQDQSRRIFVRYPGGGQLVDHVAGLYQRRSAIPKCRKIRKAIW
jgi:hypothetical protein